jgi:hypothetical protein
VKDALDGTQARLLGLLNLSLICALLVIEGSLVLGLLERQWTAAIIWVIVGVAMAWFCYHAAVNQATELVSQTRVVINLFRYEILKQIGRPVPDTPAAERALWHALTVELLGLGPDAAPAGDRAETAARSDG